MFVLLILDFIGRKFRMIIFIICRRRRMIISKVEDSSPWSNKLAGDVMQLILRRLGLSDYVRCAAVCRSWQAIIKSNIQSRRPLAQDQVPWLMLSSHPMSTRDHRVLSPGDWKDHKFLRSWPNTIFYCTMNRMDCVGSIEGWLIMVDSALRRPEGFMKPWSFYLKNCQNPSFKIEFFFFNPISGDRVMLPSSQSTLPCHCINGPDFSVSKIIASSEPKTISQEPCFVVCLCKQGHLTYCRPRDQSWSSIDHEDVPFINDIVILGGKLYATTSLESKFLMVFEMIEDAKGNGGPLSYRVVKLVTLDPNTRPSFFLIPFVKIDYDGSKVDHYNGRDFVHLAKDSASMELFMIFHKADYANKPKQETCLLAYPWHKVMLGKTFRYTEPPKTKGFRVFKLECDIDGGPQWIEIVELGDRVLFVSNHHSAVISYSHGQPATKGNAQGRPEEEGNPQPQPPNEVNAQPGQPPKKVNAQPGQSPKAGNARNPQHEQPQDVNIADAEPEIVFNFATVSFNLFQAMFIEPSIKFIPPISRVMKSNTFYIFVIPLTISDALFLYFIWEQRVNIIPRIVAFLELGYGILAKNWVINNYHVAQNWMIIKFNVAPNWVCNVAPNWAVTQYNACMVPNLGDKAAAV
ncbi:hypothetical protein D8674_032864 [Pyrus ussuriensis x Pyrus communis]|uniref:F-box domain-containing protein n=1 Tax=Pyrus ussuriensis x Pyrus communis TaxID=2448454 RepID=A0A5N5HJA1_9ROSA|nr:hypothetical protein D8674_032864 [Pyrus ussuriensis x Pyrus communis]